MIGLARALSRLVTLALWSLLPLAVVGVIALAITCLRLAQSAFGG